MARKASRRPNRAAAAENRVQVTGIIVYLTYPDGTSRVVTYDPRRVEALFWSRRAVTEMLGRYYMDKRVLLNRDHCIRCFGEHRTEQIMGSYEEVQVTPELLERLWDAPDEQGCCIGILAKDTNTIPG